MSESKKTNERQQPSMALYAVVGVICAIAVVAVLVMNSGILQRSMAAVTVNGTKYSAADMQYYYNMTYANEYNTSQTYAMYGFDYGFNYALAPEEQIYDEATGQTWKDYFMESAKEYVTGVTALYEKAVAEGHVLSEDGQAMMDQMLASVNNAWVGQYESRAAYLRANYGSYMTYDRFVQLLEREVLASDYGSLIQSGLTYTDADYETYYEEHKDALDSYTMTQFVLQAKAETTEEMTEEEKTAALEEAKQEMGALAVEIEKKLNEGVAPEEIAEEYADKLFSHGINVVRTSSSIDASSYADWAKDPSRKTGDVTLAEYDGGSSYMYYVAQFGERYRDDTKTADVRHILVGVETGEEAGEPTQEQYDAAKEKAQMLLDLWKSDGATEEAFISLVAENTADTSSASNGGLLENVSTTSGYVQTFTDWALDPSRQPGDAGLVQNTGSSVKGWHVMYYVGDDMPTWKLTADSALASEDYLAWEQSVLEGYEAVEGSGMRFVD